MRIEHVMTRDPVHCDARDTVETAARLMAAKGVGAVVVLRGGRVAGLLTDRQLACAVLAEGRAASTPVEDVMTPDPATLTLQDTVFTAVDKMRGAGAVRRLPVVDARQELVGLVSIGDIALVASKLLDAVMLDATHSALDETAVATGGQRMADALHPAAPLGRLDSEPGARSAKPAAAVARTAEPARTQEPQGLFSSLLGRKERA